MTHFPKVAKLYPHEWKKGDFVLSFREDGELKNIYKIEYGNDDRSDNQIWGWSEKGVFQIWSADQDWFGYRQWLVIRL